MQSIGWIYICPMGFFIVSGCDLMQGVVYLVWAVLMLTERIVMSGLKILLTGKIPVNEKGSVVRYDDLVCGILR